MPTYELKITKAKSPKQIPIRSEGSKSKVAQNQEGPKESSILGKRSATN